MLISDVNIKSGIGNKDFSGMRSTVTHLKIRCNLTGESLAIPYWPCRRNVSGKQMKPRHMTINKTR